VKKPRTVTIDEVNALVLVADEGGTKQFPMASPEAFAEVSRAWLRCGWDTKYVYGFTWLGRPIIQLPDDMFRLQEVLWRVKPDVILETGVAHGGSLIFHASLCRAMGKGRVIGIDIEIRPHNRAAIEAHDLAPTITLIEGSSIDPATVAKARKLIAPGETVIAILDSNHTKAHVSAELSAYGEMVSIGSYVVACDGIMGRLAGAPRSAPDWSWNNPTEAAKEFAAADARFVVEEPSFPFNESMITERVTYWPGAFVKRVA
jgi:cephalosporin hydroxylase